MDERIDQVRDAAHDLARTHARRREGPSACV